MESAPINKGNNKKSLFTCFKPDTGVDDDEDTFKPARKRQKGNATPDPVLAYLSSADEDGVVVSSAAGEVEGEECGNRRRKKGRGTWHSLKKTLNDTALVVFSFHLSQILLSFVKTIKYYLSCHDNLKTLIMVINHFYLYMYMYVHNDNIVCIVMRMA